MSRGGVGAPKFSQHHAHHALDTVDGCYLVSQVLSNEFTTATWSYANLKVCAVLVRGKLQTGDTGINSCFTGTRKIYSDIAFLSHWLVLDRHIRMYSHTSLS